MRRLSWVMSFNFLLVLTVQVAYSVTVKNEERSEASRWVAAKFLGKTETKPPEGYLMAFTKADQIEKNGVGDQPLRIVHQEYRRGLHFPSVGEVVVHLPRPAKNFECVVGVDSNGVDSFYSSAGRGSVIASVDVGEKESYRSDVLREGLPGAPVKVELGGATEFTLKLSDAGGGTLFGNDFDQADWADARVGLADGTTVWLGELPIGPMREAYTPAVPFSFRYDSQPSRELLKTWELKHQSRELDEQRTEHTLTYTDPKTGLVVRCVAIAYHDFPTVEWTVYFKNSGTEDTPIIEDIQALDTRIERDGEGEFVLHHGKGTPVSPTDYQPYETPLGRSAETRIVATGGRPTDSDLSYFNLAWPGEGIIIAVGWPGQWAAQFKRDEGNGLHVLAGQEITHLKLLPGEEVRTPLMVMQFYKGDWLRAQNVWRKWMVDDNLPRPGGKLPPPQIFASGAGQTLEMQEATEENQNMFIDRYLQEGIKIDYWWMDAGWYPFKGGWWNTGTWEPDPQRFPHGLRGVADHAHAKGVKILVWFEPERVTPGTWLYEHHPEWLLGHPDENQKLLDLGNPEARQWLVQMLDKFVNEQGVDLYRTDFNIAPLPFWRANDAPDRQGITENKYVAGFLAYFDELRRLHPNMLLDTCASGGRRNDLETLRRAVPLTRSDYGYEPTGMQNLTYGIALWIPYFGTGLSGLDSYSFRSQMTPSLGLVWDVRRRDLNYAQLRQLIAQWRQMNGFYYSDYYPLLAYDPGDHIWMAWQFDRPDLGEGVVQAFRRPDCAYDSARLRLHGLDPDANYTLTNLDVAGAKEATGRELMDQGLSVALENHGEAAIVLYKRIKATP